MAKINKSRKKELIKIKLAEIIQRDSSDPNFQGVTICKVIASPDMSTAKVYVSNFYPHIDHEKLIKDLNHAAGFFQSKLSRTLTSRNTPKLHFEYDQGFDHAQKIDAILKKL